MISFEISGDLEMFQKTAWDFARAKIRPQARTAERQGGPPGELIAEFLELGLAAVEIPDSAGGLGLGLVAKVVVEEELAFGDLGIALGMPSPGPAALALMQLGDEGQKARWLPKMVEQPGSLGWSEPRPKPRTFATVAKELADGSFELSGTKSQIVGAHAGSMIIFAQAEYQSGARRPAAFITQLPAEGVQFGEPAELLGLSAAPIFEAHFSGLRLPKEARLCGADQRFDDAVVQTFLRAGLIGAARAVGVARASFEYAQEFASERQAFGKPIAHFQGLAFLMADMAIRLEAMRALVHHAAWAFDSELSRAPRLAAMAIAECHEGAMYVTNNGVQILGGAGFVEDYPAEKWMRDAKTHMAYAMPHQLCDLLCGRQALGGEGFELCHDAPMPEIQPVFV